MNSNIRPPRPWQRTADVTVRDLEVARLDGHPQTLSEMHAEAAHAVRRGECGPDDQSRLNWIWDVVVREEWERR